MRYPEWNTWCVGRNLIDLPAGSKVTYGTEIDGAKITPLHDVHTAQQLRDLVEKRVEEVKKMPHSKADSMFLGIHDILGGGYSIRRWQVDASTELNESEVFLASQDVDPVYCTFSSYYSPEDWEKALAWYAELNAALRSRPDNTIPDVPGFCGDGFIMLETPSPRQEYAKLVARFPGYPSGLKIVFEAATSTPNRGPLADDPDVQRYGCLNLAGSEENTLSCDVLRKKSRTIGSVKGYEISVAGMTRVAPPRMYSFYWQTPGKPYDHAAPIINVSMLFTYMTNDFKSNIPGAFSSDEEALALWDSVLDTIRLRIPG